MQEDDGDNVVLINMPEDKQIKTDTATEVFQVLEGLRFDDVQMEKSDSKLKFDRSFVCELKDSTVYTIRIARTDNKVYITCDADFTDQTPVSKAEGIESEEDLKAKEAKLLAHENAKRFSAEKAGWVYELSDWQGKKLTKTLNELIEDKAQPEESTESADPNS